MSVSDLTTGRLVLRPWTVAEVTAVLGGERRTHWADDFPSEGDRVIAGFIAESDGTALGEFGQRQLVEKATGLVVGAIGLFWPPAGGVVEFGYGVVASRRGRGYATEATRALVAFALTAPGVESVVAKVELSNPASVRVLENAGLSHLDGDARTATFGTAVRA
ncbi:GNAT family N-acetyltransferase [Actinomadura sp. 9N215]|uniref:GNAT family N-acetyltransferase n=1 Tax=Actinomadura sp. 9N215 TaxID=3375150 RepID=UPI0037A611C2